MAARTKTKKIAKKKKTAAKVKVTRVTRGATMLRLERGEGDTRMFWEITFARSRSTITTRFGRHLSAGRTSTKEYDDKKKAEAAFAKAVEEKRAEGYSEPAPKQVVGGSSRKGVSAHNPELEALIEEDPSDLQRYLVYADWLQQQSDPRGELIVAQHGLETSTNNSELDSFEHIEKELFKQFGEDLLGALSQFTRVGPSKKPQRGLAWRCGFLRAARVQLGSSSSSGKLKTLGRAIAFLLDHPSSRFLECLVVAPTGYQFGASASKSLRDACTALAVEGGPGKLPKTFTTLAISNTYVAEPTLEPLRPLLPRLRKFWLTGGFDKVDIDVVHGLEELDVGIADPKTLAAIATAQWPSLKRVYLTLSVVDRVDINQTLAQILRAMPVLEHLTLQRWLVGTSPGEIQEQDDLARNIIDVFKTEQNVNVVTRLDLEMALSKTGAEDLMPALRDRPRSLRVHLPKRAVTDAVTRAAYAGELKVVFVDEDPEERARDDINPFHHTKG